MTVTIDRRAREQIIAVAACCCAEHGARRARGKLNVVTTTEDLASIAREVGGDKVDGRRRSRRAIRIRISSSRSRASSSQCSRADLLHRRRSRARNRLAAAAHRRSSRNAKIQPGAPGYLDASLNVRILEIPTGQITRAMGDVHPQGNPHYWLDPGNGRLIAQAIRDKLTAARPGDTAYFAQRYDDFDRRLAAAEKRWDATMAPYKGTKIVTYHRSWPNFVERVRPRRDRLRRAEARHSAVAVAHARAHRRR